MPRRRFPIRQSDLVRRFADRLREVRLSRGLTQATLAREANVTASYLSRLEGGRVAPGIDMIERLAAVLGTTVVDLLPVTGQPDPLPILVNEAKRMLDQLVESGARESFLRLNPILSLLVEASAKRGSAKAR
jgi:transcriptional regulator with XRE-family HTH domain